MTPLRVFKYLMLGKKPTTSYLVTLPDRSQLADFAKTDLAEMRRFREERERQSEYGASPEQLEKDFASVAEMIKRIEGRGGRVVLLWMPISGAVREIEDGRFPRKVYWDLLVARTGATASIHFTDYKSLQYDCPEGSHLDYRDAMKFTAAFADILKQKLAADQH